MTAAPSAPPATSASPAIHRSWPRKQVSHSVSVFINPPLTPGENRARRAMMFQLLSDVDVLVTLFEQKLHFLVGHFSEIRVPLAHGHKHRWRRETYQVV